tara:strand:- start:41707 stop:42132 length:426 start_codon:yes stop_codon:yes gene_type:complete
MNEQEILKEVIKRLKSVTFYTDKLRELDNEEVNQFVGRIDTYVTDSVRTLGVMASFSKAENEIGVSDLPAQNGALPLVGKSECEAVGTDEANGQSEHGTLGNRTDDGNKCPCGEDSLPDDEWCKDCKDLSDWTSGTFMKSS